MYREYPYCENTLDTRCIEDRVCVHKWRKEIYLNNVCYKKCITRGEDMEKNEEDMIVKDEEECKPIVADTVYMLSLMARFKIKGPIFPYPEDVELETGA